MFEQAGIDWPAVLAVLMDFLSEPIVARGVIFYLALELSPLLTEMLYDALGIERENDEAAGGRFVKRDGVWYERHDSERMRMTKDGRMIPSSSYYTRYDFDDDDDEDEDDLRWVI